MSAPADDAWVALAVITSPHGVSGRVKLKIFSENFHRYSDKLTLKNGEPIAFRITGEIGGGTVIEIPTLKSRNDAEAWRGRELGIARALLAPIEDDGGFYVHDLEGLRVITVDGAPLGTVASVVNYGASDIIVIHDSEGTEHMIAFTEENFPAIDIAGGTLTCNPPEIMGGDSREAS